MTEHTDRREARHVGGNGVDPFSAPTITADDRRPALPHNSVFEQAVLGGILLRPELLRAVRLTTGDFFDPRHQRIWDALAAQDADGDPIDAATLQARLERDGRLSDAGGKLYLAEIGLRCPTVDNVEHYASMVRELAERRHLRLAASQIAGQDLPAKELRAKLARLIDTAADPGARGPQWLNRGEIVDLIRSRATEPWVRVGLGMSVITEVRAGGLVTLAGPTGAGKTSLAMAIALAFAREQGWLVVVSLELSADEMGGRGIGIVTDAGWGQVLRGELTDSRMLEALPERMVMTEWNGATLDALDAKLTEIRATHPADPTMFVVDYGQLLESAAEEQRARVAANWQSAKRLAAKHRAVGLVLSQMSRVASRAARGGQRVGADAVDGGAESAAIERWSSLVLEVGQAGPEDEYGRRQVQLSIAKERMNGGDKVLPMSYEGRTGRWAVIGDARPAAEVREQAKAKSARVDVQNALLAIRQAAELAPEPRTREELIATAGVQKVPGRAAINLLLNEHTLVEVRRKRPKAGSWQIWTPAKAEVAGIEIIGAGVAS